MDLRGVGKTHLVNAVGNAVREKFPDRRVLFVSARNFQVQYAMQQWQTATTEIPRLSIALSTFTKALICSSSMIFKKSAVKKTLKAFFHIFNHLHANGRKMLFTCDRSPAELKGLEERILSRLRWGITLPLDQPDRTFASRHHLVQIAS